jgi:hypothetical protein
MDGGGGGGEVTVPILQKTNPSSEKPDSIRSRRRQVEVSLVFVMAADFCANAYISHIYAETIVCSVMMVYNALSSLSPETT